MVTKRIRKNKRKTLRGGATLDEPSFYVKLDEVVKYNIPTTQILRRERGNIVFNTSGDNVKGYRLKNQEIYFLGRDALDRDNPLSHNPQQTIGSLIDYEPFIYKRGEMLTYGRFVSIIRPTEQEVMEYTIPNGVKIYAMRKIGSLPTQG